LWKIKKAFLVKKKALYIPANPLWQGVSGRILQNAHQQGVLAGLGIISGIFQPEQICLNCLFIGISGE
jgi:hypothetical protein